MKTTHTPGPWKVLTFPETNYQTITSNDGAICNIPADSKRIPEHEANARLIAAAPELLEALQAILIQHSPALGGIILPPSQGELEMIERAIKKATT